MAVFNVNNDNHTVRFDTGSMFGGIYDRSGVDDAAIIKLTTVGSQDILTQTNAKYGTSKVEPTLTNPNPPVNDYRIIMTGSIDVRDRWDPSKGGDLNNSFLTAAGEPASSDYKLDWGKASFSSIKYQIPSYDAELNVAGTEYDSWITLIEVATTSDTLNLPFRANEFDPDWVKSFELAYVPSYDFANDKVKKDSADAFEYQSVVYNWQYPFGTSSAQYLFGDDSINGTRNDDVIRGYAGDDLLRGNAGDDLMYADHGKDLLFGGPGDDVLVFGGSSSSWDVDDFVYRTTPIELAVGGSGSDMFVFRPSEINWSGKDDVYYNMSLPNLYNGKFKYKKILDSELEDGYFRVKSNGEIVTRSSTGTETKVPNSPTISEKDNPFLKYQKINASLSGSNVETNGNENKLITPSVTLPTVSPSDLDSNYFYVDVTGVVYKQSKDGGNAPFTPLKTAATSTTNFKLTTNPFNTASVPLNVKISENHDIVTLDGKYTVKIGQDVVLNSRFDDDDGVIDLTPDGVSINDGDHYARKMDDNWHYNPFLSQSQNDTYMGGATGATRAATDPANGLSNLTQRIKIQDFKIGTDKIDLSAFGFSTDLLTDKTLVGKNGTSYLTALNTLLTPEKIKITYAKNGWTSGNTSLFLKEAAADYNGNGTNDDTLLEIQLVGINISSVNGRFFGETALATGNYEISY